MENNDLYPQSYGNWAGCPDGFAPDFSKCCESVRVEGRWASYHQCRRPRGFGPGEAYCKQHDPAAKAERQEKAHALYNAKSRQWRLERYSSRFLVVLRQIADGHNDPRALAKEIISDFEE